MKTFCCCCCGSSFRSNKPQDPDRDTGFGTCTDCHDFILVYAVKHGFHLPDDGETTHDPVMIRAHWEKYA